MTIAADNQPIRVVPVLILPTGTISQNPQIVLVEFKTKEIADTFFQENLERYKIHSVVLYRTTSPRSIKLEAELFAEVQRPLQNIFLMLKGTFAPEIINSLLQKEYERQIGDIFKAK
jgi:hypothetical protein